MIINLKVVTIVFGIVVFVWLGLGKDESVNEKRGEDGKATGGYRIVVGVCIFVL